jgi:hypothetical protein
MEEMMSRYLRPGARWTAADDRAMRELLRRDEAARAYYDRAVVRHRLFSGGSADMPSGLERARMEAALLDTVAPIPSPGLMGTLKEAAGSWRTWAAGLGVLGAATAAVLLAQRNVVVAPVHGDDYIGARSGAHDPVTVGIGLSGVTESNREYEVIAGDGVYAKDFLRITTTREVETHGYVAVLGLQDGRDLVWYSPDPAAGETASQPVARERSVPLGGKDAPVEFQVSSAHVPGRLIVAAIFTNAPVSASELGRALGGMQLVADAAADSLLPSLTQVAPDAIVRLVEVDVLPGSRADAD